MRHQPDTELQDAVIGKKCFVIVFDKSGYIQDIVGMPPDAGFLGARFSKSDQFHGGLFF
jgi:hypothetical protein